jgi:hypothetical protein
MVPVLILGIHNVAVVAGGRFVLQVGWRVRHPGEDAQRSRLGKIYPGGDPPDHRTGEQADDAANHHHGTRDKQVGIDEWQK